MKFLLMTCLNHGARVLYAALKPEGTVRSHLKVIVPPAHTTCREAPTQQGKAKCVPERQKQKMREGRAALAQSRMEHGPCHRRNREHCERAQRAGRDQAPDPSHRYAERH